MIRSHCVVYEGVTVGERFECGHHVTIREGCRIGDGVRVGTACDLQPEVSSATTRVCTPASSPRAAR